MLLKKAAIVNAGAMTGILIATAQTILLTRWLGPAAVGQYALAVATLSLAATLCAFGIPLSFLYHAKRSPADKKSLFANAFWALTSIGILSGVVVAAFFNLNQSYFGRFAPHTLVAVLLFLPFSLLRLLFRNHLLIDIQAKRLALIDVMAIGTSMGFVLLAIGIGRLTVNTALLAFVLAAFARAALAWRWVGREVDMTLRPDGKLLRRLGRMGSRQMWPDFLTILNDQVGILLLKWLRADFAEIGYFSRALSIATLLIMLSQAVMPLVFSRVAGLEDAAVGQQVEKALRFITTFAMGMMLAIILCGEWIVLLLYGSAFLPAVAPMRILAAGAALTIVNRTLLQMFNGRGMPEKGSAALAIGCVVTAAACAGLVPSMGMMGCALSIASGQLVVTLLLFWHGQRCFDLAFSRCVLINPDDWKRIHQSVSARYRKSG